LRWRKALSVRGRDHPRAHQGVCAIRHHAGRFWLSNRRPRRWKEASKVEVEATEESPLAILARELAGTALRPRELPPPEPIKVEDGVVVSDQEEDAPPPRPMGKGK